MTLDLTRPEHREALRWAAEQRATCTDRECDGAVKWLRSMHSPDDPFAEALRSLSSPSDCAALVRALLDGCGVETHIHEHGDCGECTSDVQVAWDDEHVSVIAPWDAWVVRDIYALVLRLLACTTKEEALAALRSAA